MTLNSLENRCLFTEELLTVMALNFTCEQTRKRKASLHVSEIFIQEKRGRGIGHKQTNYKVIHLTSNIVNHKVTCNFCFTTPYKGWASITFFPTLTHFLSPFHSFKNN